jgi:hypothetical protein
MNTFAPLGAAPLGGIMEFPDQFVASFGKDAALGCFTAAGPLRLARHDRVLLQTPRGLEVGEILGPATIRQARLLGPAVRGQLIRPLSSADHSTIERMTALADELLTASERVRSDLGADVSILDAETFFDLRHALLHILHPHPDDLGAFTEALSSRTGLLVRLANLALPAEPEEHGCGKPDCGSGAGGCATCSNGGCSTGCGTGSATDLRPYFAHLREQMDAHARVPLL